MTCHPYAYIKEGMLHSSAALSMCWCSSVQSKAEEQAYHKLIVTRLKEQRERRSESLAKKRAVRQASQASRELSQASKQ